MFGGLFDDESRDDSSVPTTRCGVDRPPLVRDSKSLLCGLQNQGATCYLNSLLQTLFLTPEFRDALFRLSSEELGENAGAGNQVRAIPIELRRLFARLLLLDVKAVSTELLTNSFGWTSNEELQQHDVQELNRILFAAIDSSLVRTSGSHLIRNLYHGTLVNEIICQTCHRVSERQEEFLDISLPVVGHSGLRAALQSSFVEKEMMSADNQYFCETCARKVDALKGAVLSHLPQVLTFSLLRFQYDWKKGERYKETGRFIFPSQLDMSPFCNTESSEALYDLFSVVVHQGSAHGGHYYAYIRDVDDLGKWSHPDTDISVITEEDGQLDVMECDSPAELLKTLLVHTKEKSATIDKLCKLLHDKTGVTWNKRFRHKHGPILKFLKRYTDVFLVSNSGSVSLIKKTDDMSSDPATSEQSTSGQATSSISSEQAASPTVTSGTPTPPTDMKSQDEDKSRNEQAAPPAGQCWFSFNDSWVASVNSKLLDRTYAGRESAYMLFYRRHSSSLCPGRDAVLARIPDHLQAEIAAENTKLSEDRLAFDIAVHTVALHVHFKSDYIYQFGVLQRAKGTEERISLDRRKPVGALVEEIKKLLEARGEAYDMVVLHSAKPCPSGLHLLECVSADLTKTLTDMAILQDCHLLVWEEDEGEEKPLLVGEDNLPFLIALQLSAESPQTIDRPFPKSLTVAKLKTQLSAMSNISPSALHITVLSPGTSSPHLLTVEGSKTVSEAGLRDGSRLICSSSDDLRSNGLRAASMPVQKCAQTSLVVENHCVKLSKPSDPWPVSLIYVNATTTIAEVKKEVFSTCDLPHLSQSECRVRTDEPLGLGPPVKDDDTVGALNFADGQQLLLEPGQAPAAGQILLCYMVCGAVSSLSTVKKGDMREIIVDITSSVQQVLQVILAQCSISGEEWHLRKTNWCGEAGELLEEPTSSLGNESVKNGDLLFLEPGRLPPKGFFGFPVYLTASAPPTEESSEDSWLQWMTTKVSELFTGKSPKDADGDLEPVKKTEGKDQPDMVLIDHIEISKESTVVDLKQLIMTLPAISALNVPLPGMLRLSCIQEGRMTSVLRDLSVLRRTKLTSASQIACTVLAGEESLPNSSLLIFVRRRLPQRTYGEVHEVVFDTSQGASLPLLRRCIAEHFNMEENNVLLAKRQKRTSSWLVLEERFQAPNSGKGGKRKKKHSPKPMSLRQAPVHLQEGDLLGLKDTSLDRGDSKDFCTASDDEGQAVLEAEKARKRQERKARKTAADHQTTAQRRPEPGVRISVPSFLEQ